MITKSKKLVAILAFIAIVAVVLFGFTVADKNNVAFADTTTYTVTFNGNGGTLTAGAATVTVASGTAFSAIPKPTYAKAGYTFSHWSLSSASSTAMADSATISGDVTIYANWTAVKCQILFVLNGGTRVGGGALAQDVDYGGDATAPVVTRAGYTFYGWSGVYEDVTQSATVTALWTPVNYTVTFNVNSGSLVGGTLTATVGSGTLFEAVSKPTLQRAGYTLDYYSTDANGYYPISAATPITAATTVYAQWKINSYTVTYDPAGGVLSSGALTQTVQYGGDATAPTVTRAGYTFAGWSDISTSVTANRNITASWTPNTYTVTFNVNSGSLLSGSLTATVESGTTFAAISRPSLQRAGYDFAYYAFDSAGNSVVTDNYSIGGNVTIYAVWKVKSYTVTFDTAGGELTAGALEQLVPGGTLYSAVTTPTVAKPGYTFSYWLHSNGQALSAISASAINENVTLTAVYTANNYTVTFALSEGTLTGGSAALTVAGGTSYKDLIFPTIAKTGYTFCYWQCNGKPYALAENDTIVSNVTITAVFGEITEAVETSYTLLFDANGGTVMSGNVAQTIINGTNYGKILEVLPTVAKTGYKFEYWATTAGVNIETTPTTVITADTTLIAVYSELRTFTVTFDLNGGTLVGGTLTQQVAQGENAITPIVTRAGYTFAGWEGGSATNVNGNLTLTAKWVDANGNEPGGFSTFWQKIADFFNSIFDWFRH